MSPKGPTTTAARWCAPCGPGWDGPTGLGTPVGVSALAFGVHGTLSGRITDSASGAPLAGAALAVSEEATGGREYHVTTDADGAYSLPVAVGDYRITVTDFGYRENTRSGVAVAEDRSTTADLTLVKLPTRTVSGTVKDGSGHGWPLYSKITIDGYPNGALYTDPYTGRYSVDLPEEATYAVHVAPVYPGYRSTDLSVPVGTADVRADVAPDVDLTACVAPGHAYPGAADFGGWTGTTPEHGWTVVDHGTEGATWDFADSFLANYTGGTGNWAAADPWGRGGVHEDTELVSPTFSLAGQNAPVLGFDALYAPSKDSVADVDLSLDSGATWTTVWHRDTAEYLGHVEVPLTQAANAKHVKVRFHYSGSGLSIWQLDTVTVGSCAAVSGGIVAGKVVDGNTGDAITPATITDTADGYATATTVATPDDPALADGYYWLFSTPVGRHTYRTAAARYTTSTGTLTTRPDKVNRFDRTLKAGRLAVSSAGLSVSETLGGSGSKKVTFTNKGQAPLHVDLGEQSTGYTSPDGTSTYTVDSSAGAPTLRVKGNYSPGPMSSPPRGHEEHDERPISYGSLDRHRRLPRARHGQRRGHLPGQGLLRRRNLRTLRRGVPRPRLCARPDHRRLDTHRRPPRGPGITRRGIRRRDHVRRRRLDRGRRPRHALRLPPHHRHLDPPRRSAPGDRHAERDHPRRQPLRHRRLHRIRLRRQCQHRLPLHPGHRHLDPPRRLPVHHGTRGLHRHHR